MPKLLGKAIIDRSRELAGIKYKVIGEFIANPTLSTTEVAKRYNLSPATVYGWVVRTKIRKVGQVITPIISPVSKKHGTVPEIVNLLREGYTRQGLAKEGYAERTIDKAIFRFKEQQKQPTEFERIINSVPNIQTLGILILEGFNAALASRDLIIDDLKKELNDVVKERDKIMEDFNSRLTKAKIGTLTLDQVQHRLVKKE